MSAITATWWWTTRLVWSISAAGRFRTSTDCSRRGIQAVGRIAEMIREMDLKPGEMKLIVNRAPNGVLNPGVMEEINKYGLQLAGVLPQDETVYEYDCEGKPSSQVPDDTPVKTALAAVMRDLNL